MLTNTTTFNNFSTATARNRRPGLVDAFFKSAPLLAVLRRQRSVTESGGDGIHEHLVYAGMGGGSYSRGSTFDTSTKEFMTDMRFDWKRNYVPVNLHTIDIEDNDSDWRVFNLVDAAMNNGELTMIDNLSTQVFSNGGGDDLDGLENSISQSGAYGGITRSAVTGTSGYAVRSGADDSTGGALSLPNMNIQFGNCVVGREKPNMLVTTQLLWNKIWARSQPSERNPNPGTERDIGFESVRFNGADVVVDSHCASGTIYMLNTKWYNLYVHNKWNFRFRGPMEQVNQQVQIGQLIFWGNLVCTAPRYQGKMTGVTET